MRYGEDVKASYLNSLIQNYPPGWKLIQDKENEMGLEGMTLNPHEGQILYFLCKLVRPKNVLEIGTALGGSASWMLQAVPEECQFTTIEKNAQRAQWAKTHLTSFFPQHSVEVITGEGVSVLNGLKPQAPFDLVFIDGNKSDYSEYFSWVDKNTAKGSVVIWDNAFLYDSVWTGEKPAKASVKTVRKMIELNKEVFKSPRYTAMMLPTHEGLAVALKTT